MSATVALLPRKAHATHMVQTEQSPYPYPYSLDPLPADLKRGLWPIGICALISVASTLGLLSWITYRLVAWRKHYRSYVGYNQYVLLIYNLLLADLFQSLSFLISFHWIHDNSMMAPSTACFTQAWLVQIGDVSSGMFVLAIALHTFFSVVKGRQLPFRSFLVGVISIWVISLMLTIIGPAMHGQKYFTAAGAWCWASEDYETERLWLHYLWIFIIEFGTLIVYALIFLYLRKHLTNMSSAGAAGGQSKVSQAARYMVVYPLAYVLLTLPLAAGRMATMTGNMLPLPYYCAAGSMMTSSGFIDVALYTLTRRVLVSEEIDPRKESGGGVSSGRKGYGKSSTTGGGWSFDKNAAGLNDHTVTITGGCDTDGDFIDMKNLSKGGAHVSAGERSGRTGKHSKTGSGNGSGVSSGSRSRSLSPSSRDPTPRGSTDSILAGMGMMGVRAETKVEVTSEPMDNFLLPVGNSTSATVEITGNSGSKRAVSPY